MRFVLFFRLVTPAAMLALAACASTEPKAVIAPSKRAVPASRRVEFGVASWHGPSPFSRQSRTASGKKWSNSALIAAHKSLPLGTFVRVTHLKTKREVVVQVIDRGPYVRGRIVDLSPQAAEAIGIKGSGVGQVKLEVVQL